MDELIKMVKSLLSDIEAMRSKDAHGWFGGFSEFRVEAWGTSDEVAMIEWPNLTLSADNVKLLLEAVEIVESHTPALQKKFVNIDMCELTVRLCETMNDIKRPPGLDATKSLQALPEEMQRTYTAVASVAMDYIMEAFTVQGVPIVSDKPTLN